jgi:hypothetical protein
MLWSRRIMVIALASIGRDMISMVIVIIMDHESRFMLIIFILLLLLLVMVVITLIDLKREEILFMCSDMMVKLIDILLFEDKGGYKVHPVLVLLLIIILVIMVRVDIFSIHNLMLLVRGNAMSFIGFIIGIIQLVILLIMIGMVMKKIINRACVVMIELKVELLFINLLVCIISIRMMILREVPIILDHSPIIRYIIPIVLWLVDVIFFIVYVICKFAFYTIVKWLIRR